MNTAATTHWKPSDGYIGTRDPEPVDGATDDEGGIDIELAVLTAVGIDTQPLDFDIDLAAALAAWQPDDWHGVHSRPVADSVNPVLAGDRLHTFLFSHSVLTGLDQQGPAL
ncbi:MAG: hypothetical protein RL375_4568 [Pseudomonadota bacterium]|jgi:hypothetical protein